MLLAQRERVKELTCLYEITQRATQAQASVEEILRAIVSRLPAAWQYPEIASARIILDGRTTVSEGFVEGPQRQVAPILIEGEARGVVEILYAEEKPAADEGPFLREERRLIDTMASELSMILQRRKAEEDRVKLQEQLRHADRLATIGQISAGVAHELNEPLGSILGFAQLAMKHAEVPAPVIRDLHKIEAASLHARAPCSSSERAAPARSWLREPSTTAARGPRPPSFR